MKKIFTLFAALTMVMSMSAATKTIYFKTQQWWHKDDAASAAYYWEPSAAPTWPGIRMTKVDGVADILTGKIESGTVRVGQSVKAINMRGEFIENAKITKIIEHRGIEKISRDTASAGDIVVVAGFSKATVSDTLCDPSITEPI